MTSAILPTVLAMLIIANSPDQSAAQSSLRPVEGAMDVAPAVALQEGVYVQCSEAFMMFEALELRGGRYRYEMSSDVSEDVDLVDSAGTLVERTIAPDDRPHTGRYAVIGNALTLIPDKNFLPEDEHTRTLVVVRGVPAIFRTDAVRAWSAHRTLRPYGVLVYVGARREQRPGEPACSRLRLPLGEPADSINGVSPRR